jgi:hypothetical protein
VVQQKTTPKVKDATLKGASAFGSPPVIDPFMDKAGSCPCGGRCPRCAGSAASRSPAGGQTLPASLRSRLEAVQRADFSEVRVHPHAPEITTLFHARAVTQGQDIYFRPGQFRPDTPAGEALLAHELAHTVQTRQPEDTSGARGGLVSHPGDAWERNADARARGEPVPVLPAPAHAVLRSTFDSEGEEDRARRERLLQSISNAIDHILHLLRTGGLVAGAEVAAERGGVGGVIYGPQGDPNDLFVSYAERDARLRRVVRSLIDMATRYRSAPIPAEYSAPTQIVGAVSREGEPPVSVISYASTVPVPGGTDHFVGRTPEWADLQSAYMRYRLAQGQTGSDYDWDWYYLNPENMIVPGAARGAPRIGRGVPSGAYMVVPDVEREPLRYWRLDGFTPIPRGSVIVELWHDDFGYYYLHRSRRIDVPSPWR